MNMQPTFKATVPPFADSIPNIKSLDENMIMMKGSRNMDNLITYIIDNEVVIPSVSNPGKSYTTRYLLMQLDFLKNKKDINEADFKTIPSYSGFRDKVKDLLGFNVVTSGK